MNTTLLIMAAGIGSRFGTGIKQLSQWMILDIPSWIIPFMMRLKQVLTMWYLLSVRISRRSSKRSSVELASAHNVTVDYAFQDINDIPGTLPERTLTFQHQDDAPEGSSDI